MKAAVGCVIRDSNGRWVRGCKSMIGLAVPITAQLWSIFYGLKLAWENEEKNVVVECDCEEAVNQVHNPDPGYDMFNLVCMIKQLMSEAWDHCELVLISASANTAVAAIANNAINDNGGIEELGVPPSYITSILAAEKRD